MFAKLTAHNFYCWPVQSCQSWNATHSKFANWTHSQRIFMARENKIQMTKMNKWMPRMPLGFPRPMFVPIVTILNYSIDRSFEKHWQPYWSTSMISNIDLEFWILCLFKLRVLQTSFMRVSFIYFLLLVRCAMCVRVRCRALAYMRCCCYHSHLLVVAVVRGVLFIAMQTKSRANMCLHHSQ